MRKIICTVLMVVLSVTLLSGCSKTQKDSTEGTASQDAATATKEPAKEEASGLDAELKKELAKYTADPVCDLSALEAFDAKSVMAGKKVLCIPANADDFSDNVTSCEKEIADQIGFEYFVYENSGKVDEQIAAVEYAIINGYDYIELLGGVSPLNIGSAIKKARDAGVEVYTSHVLPEGYDMWDSTDFDITVPYKQAGEAMALYAINKIGADKINCLYVSFPDVDSTKAISDGIHEVFDKYAPGKLQQIDVTFDFASIPQQVANTLLADQSINFVINDYDSMTPMMLQGIEQVGMKDKVSTTSFNGTPAILEMVKSGDVTMDVGESLDWAAYSIMDGLMRHVAGYEVPEASGIPCFIWDSSNIERNLDSAGNTTYGGFMEGLFRESYEKLWGLK